MYEELMLKRLRGQDKNFNIPGLPWPGTILGAAEAQSEKLFVMVPLISSEMKQGPCLWTPRPGTGGPVLPVGGEKCLVIRDMDKQWWITEWWPYA